MHYKWYQQAMNVQAAAQDNTPPRPDGAISDENSPALPAVTASPQPSTHPPFNSPSLVPDYELLRRIGGGSYGEVWLARSATGVLRAVKIVYRDNFDNDRPFEREFEGIQRFERLSREHPSQLALYHVGRNDAAGCFYCVMELADDAGGEKEQGREGEREQIPSAPFPLFSPASYAARTLRHELKQRGRLPVEECLKLGLPLTEALAHLHANGLIHRDIKPSNIIFVGGKPKLADIGLVTNAAVGDDARSIVGTEGYLAPEGPGRSQADLFALGKVLYEAATGLDRRQFPQLPTDLRAWPDAAQVFELNEILLKACATNPRERYARAEEMRADLELLRVGRSVKRRQAWQEARRFALRLSAAAALIIAAWFLFNRFNGSTVQRSLASTPASIFVLPFRNDGTNQADELLHSRITDALIDGLALIDGVKVGPRKSGWINRDEEEVRREVGKQFHSRFALSGRVKANSNELSITLALHDATGVRALWSESSTNAPGDQIELGRRIIQRTAQKLGLKVSDEAMPRITQTLQNNLKALEMFRQAPGIGTFTRDDFSRKIEFLSQATTLDPRFAQAHAALAQAHAHASE